MEQNKPHHKPKWKFSNPQRKDCTTGTTTQASLYFEYFWIATPFVYSFFEGNDTSEKINSHYS